MSERMLIEKGTEHVEEFQPWATRIPAAIKRAEELLLEHPYIVDGETIITATEVALAKALWEEWVDNPARTVTMDYDPTEAPPVSLRAFTEKVEEIA